MRYTRMHRPLRTAPRFAPVREPEDILSIGAEGDVTAVIVQAGRPDLARAARDLGMPVVNIFGGRNYCSLPQVDADDLAVGRLAAEHLAELGLSHFTFIGMAGGGFSASRWLGFRNELRRRNLSVERFCRFATYPHVALERRPLVGFGQEIANWLSQLPRPVGVFCVNDLVGTWVAEVCELLEFSVPDDVAILGVNDDPFCLETSPPLSSIRLPDRQIGYEAARLLDRILRGEKLPAKPILLPPEVVEVRQSTNTLAMKDPHVVRAVRFIRENAKGALTVEDVLDHASVSRQGLDLRFRKALGHTVFAEIRRVQIEQAKQLLRDTDQTMEAVARNAGFGSGIHLSLEFKKRTGQSPGAYRRQFRRM
jgi:LacI family transcriptional regulator